MTFNMNSNGWKAALQLFCLLAAILCFSVAAQAQSVGSTGEPFLDIEFEKVCYSSPSGIDSTLNSYKVLGDGQITPLIQSIKYFDATGKEIFPDTTNGSIVFGMCGGLDIETDTLKFYTDEQPMCDFNEALADPYFAFIRVYMRALNLNTDSVTTIGFDDFDYDGQSYNPSGQVGIYLCAEVDTTSTIDYEYIEQCMIDSIDVTNQFEFIRLFRYADTVKSFIDVYTNTYEPYTLVGAVQKKCAKSEAFFITELCDKEVVNVAFEYIPDTSPKDGFLEANLSITSTLLNFNKAVSLMTIDCGQGEIYSSRVANCDCNFNDLPDGYYYPKVAINYLTGGTKVLSLGTVHISDGNIITGSLGVTYSQDITVSATKFIRRYEQDLTFADYELDGQTLYPVAFTPGSCDFDNEGNDVLIPSTKPNLKINNQECWQQDLTAGTYVNHEVVWNNASPFSVIGIRGTSGTSGTIPIGEVNLHLPNAEQDLIEAISDYLVAQGHRFHSVTVEVLGVNNYIIRINQLEEGGDVFGFFVGTSFDPATNSGTGISSIGIDTLTVVADTALFFDVSRYQHNGAEAIVIDAYGNETYLPDDAYKVQCGGGSNNNEDGCDDLLRLTHVQRYTDTLITFPAETIFAYDVRPVVGNPVVTNGADTPTVYPSTYGNNFNLPRCYKIANNVVIDLTGGQSAMVSWIE